MALVTLTGHPTLSLLGLTDVDVGYRDYRVFHPEVNNMCLLFHSLLEITQSRRKLIYNKNARCDIIHKPTTLYHLLQSSKGQCLFI